MKDELKIVEPEVEEVAVSYADHMGMMESLADEMNVMLRSRGFHLCEASVVCDWKGNAILTQTSATNGTDPVGHPLMFTANCVLPPPWMTPKEHRLEPADMLTKALAGIEDVMMGMCSKAGVFRVSYTAFCKKMSKTIATATQMPETNGRSAIIRP
jgi:hypothetical protein